MKKLPISVQSFEIMRLKIVSHAKAVGATGHVHTFKRRFL